MYIYDIIYILYIIYIYICIYIYKVLPICCMHVPGPTSECWSWSEYTVRTKKRLYLSGSVMQ